MIPLRWRKMTWVIVLFTILMAVLIYSATQATTPCPPDIQNCDAYRAGQTVGQGLGIMLFAGIWFVGFIILSIIWFMTRPARRVCPACGHEARKGQTTCKRCGYNFASPPLSGSSHAVSHPAPAITGVPGSEIKSALARACTACGTTNP